MTVRGRKRTVDKRSNGRLRGTSGAREARRGREANGKSPAASYAALRKLAECDLTKPPPATTFQTQIRPTDPITVDADLP
jgi:ribosomal protein L25 (general stress protein Ctc)